jgi:hypothetical protein
MPRGMAVTRTTLSVVPSSREGKSKPLRDRFLEMARLPAIESRHTTVRDIEVAVVVNQDLSFPPLKGVGFPADGQMAVASSEAGL